MNIVSTKMRKIWIFLAVFALACLISGMPVSAVGEVAAWGDDGYGQCSKTPAGDEFIQVAVGYFHSLALTEDGTIVAWGQDDFGQCSDAPQENGFTQVEAGLHHSLALTEDGTIVAWGRDDFGQCSDAPQKNGFSQVAAGGLHSLALTGDGTIVAWGNDLVGQCGRIPTETGYTQVAAGFIHNLALTEDGTIVAWGCDIFGDCTSTPTGNGYTQVSAGGVHSLALSEDQTVTAWGNNWFGQCTNEPGGDHFKQVDAGFAHNLALTEEGTIVAWGSDYFGQCSDTPKGDGYTQVAAGLNHNLELICTMFSPHASIRSRSFCDEGSEISFDASQSENICDATRFIWTFGDGGTGSGETVDHIYTENGEYEVTLTVMNPYGLTDTATITVTVSNVAPTIDFFSIPDSARVGTMIHSVAQFSDPGPDNHEASLNWSDSNGNDGRCIVSEQERTISGSHVYTKQGEYHVTLTLTDDDGGVIREMSTVRVTGTPMPAGIEKDRDSNKQEPMQPETVPEFPVIAVPGMIIVGLTGVVFMARRKE